MKPYLTKYCVWSTALLTLLAVKTATAADLFSVDSRTTTIAGSGVTVSNLYANGFATSTTNTFAPNGSAIWYVVDQANNGVPTNFSGGLPGFGPGGVLGADDYIVWVDNIDGGLPGTRIGASFRSFQNAMLDRSSTTNSFHYFFYLWNFANSPVTTTGQTNFVGITAPVVNSSTFGLVDFGVKANPAALVNLNLDITQNVWADQYAVVVGVPEPSTIALAGIGSLGLIALRRRKK